MKILLEKEDFYNPIKLKNDEEIKDDNLKKYKKAL